MIPVLFVCMIAGADAATPVVGQSATQATVNFRDQVQPILAARCLSCHGPDESEGGLSLDQRESALAELDSGDFAIVPGNVASSTLLQRVASDDESMRMPPDDEPLSAAQVDMLRRWVQQGAPWQQHWAFQTLRKPTIPAVEDTKWVRNPIDAFVLSQLNENDLQPAPEADRVTLIRRVFYDLVGLPPTPSDVDAYIADTSETAYEKLVDRLLDSAQYGEQWGRHWLDLARYAETNSFERDNPKPHVWRYRDYVIRSFNEDKPYDQFVREQLAGDESPNPTADEIIATGYYRLGLWDDEPSDRLQAKYDVLDDIVKTTSQLFLGLTIDCARCHEHKIDPIPQEDYYRLLAFFHNITPMQTKGENIETPIVSAPDAKPGETGKALCVTEHGRNAPETFVLMRGSAHAPGEKVDPGFPSILGDPDPQLMPAPPGVKSSGRRTALAHWLTSPDNRLTARVMVNRIWQYHFGRGIVRSANNFGLRGTPPTHPDLLDWLACEFIARGWRLKEMHRLILTSSTYRMSSRGHADALARDPANNLLWRFDLRRLGAEQIRDSILAVNGTLNPKMYGPSIYPEIPAEVLQGQSRPGHGWGKSSPDEQARRSIYIHVKRSLLTPILETFDLADPDNSCPVRFSTTQPTQALAMLNSKFLQDQAELLAGRLRREAGDDLQDQVALALRLATSRRPTDEEVQRGLTLIRELREKDGATVSQAFDYFCLTVLNLNEFVYLD